jgi:16S rRNA (cytosine967-C5)-methyltransferase
VNESATAPPLADALRVAAYAWARLRAGTSLDRALEAAQQAALAPPHPRLAAAAKDIAYTATRHLALIDAATARIATRPPDAAVGALAAVALGQLVAGRHADYAVVDQAVRAAKADDATRAASGFINALLRRWLRERDALTAALLGDETVRFNAPRWWIERVRAAHGERADALLELQRRPPPLTLRVNRRRVSVDQYLERLAQAGIAAEPVGASAVRLDAPRPVGAIPGFEQGDVSVQDAGAQLAAQLLDVRDGMRVLDACAAPGGKTAQLAELAAIELDAVEIDRARAARIESNLARTAAHAHARIRVIVGDAAQPRAFAPAAGYDRILLDAPCTASGIVRRHPDIPWLRRPDDVAQLATLQARLLDALWPVLSRAGRLLYVVCSVFSEEGERQARSFLARRADARAVPLAAGAEPFLQLLPDDVAQAWRGGLPTVHDGFFFALFEKS